MAALSTAAVRSLSTAATAALSTDSIVALSTAQAAALSTAQVGALTTGQVAAMDTADVVALGTAGIRALDTADIVAMSSDQLSRLSTAQVAALSTAQVAAIATDDLQAMTTAQIAALTTAQTVALTTAQFAALETADIVALTTAQFRALTTAQIVALTTDQAVALETRDIAALTTQQMAAFESADVGVLSGAQLDAFLAASPIVLDLDGNGVSTRSAADGVQFDLNATGQTFQVGWASTTDGLLVMDRNRDGSINDGRELFGVATQTADGTRAGHGYAAMSLEDSNRDGKLSAADASFKDLQLWIDANHDGKTDKGELRSLGEFGIVELDLNAQVGTEVDNGNLLGLTSSYTTADGAQHAMADVWFAKEPAPALGDLLVAPTAEVLPGAPLDADTTRTAAAVPAAHHNTMPIDRQLFKDDESKNNPLI
ncbi:MAG: hypothetical protein AD742_19190 [Methylibium sp. NZG]|nr:MAG: hypothetical protein AD742_19190 [Methylibium sp. NZG]